jgi:hypothetical protein
LAGMSGVEPTSMPHILNTICQKETGRNHESLTVINVSRYVSLIAALSRLRLSDIFVGSCLSRLSTTFRIAAKFRGE